MKIQNKWQTLACCQGNSEIALLRTSQPDWCAARTAKTGLAGKEWGGGTDGEVKGGMEGAVCLARQPHEVREREKESERNPLTSRGSRK